MNDDDKHPSRKRIKIRPNNVGSRKISCKWIVTITLWTFFLSAGMQMAQMGLINRATLPVAFIILIVIIAIGIVFDIVGVSVTAASEVPFHSLCARKIRGAQEAVALIRNADKVGSFCNDVIGDIAGIVSGSATGAIVASLSAMTDASPFVTTIVLTGCVAALTIGGKALGKGIAILNCNSVVFLVGKIVSLVKPRRRGRKS